MPITLATAESKIEECERRLTGHDEEFKTVKEEQKRIATRLHPITSLIISLLTLAVGLLWGLAHG